MSQLKLHHIAIHYGEYCAVNNVSLSLESGEIVCLLGPSGCGKTSLQRAIAGFEPVTTGSIELAEKIVSSTKKTVNPEDRQVGMVFQDFALFPHLTVDKNIGFGLSKLNRKDRQSRIHKLIKMVGLEGHDAKYPHEISGGQQQRVALARAIAPQPDILLLDEPFSSLDTALRESLAKDVRTLLKENNITAIFVTHDQNEAFALADKVGVMNAGQLLQWDTPYNLYHNPNSRFVANFIGEGKIISGWINEKKDLETHLGTVEHGDGWQHETGYSVLVRPDDILFDPDSDHRLNVKDKIFRGAEYLYELSISKNESVLCVTPSHIDVAIGDTLPIKTDLRHLVVFSDEPLSLIHI